MVTCFVAFSLTVVQTCPDDLKREKMFKRGLYSGNKIG
jgi:hypothetical protein